MFLGSGFCDSCGFSGFGSENLSTLGFKDRSFVDLSKVLAFEFEICWNRV